MKTWDDGEKNHLVPLTQPIKDLLWEMEKVNGGTEFVFASLVAASKDVAVVWRCHSKNGLSSWTWYCLPAISSVAHQDFVDSVFKSLVLNGRC